MGARHRPLEATLIRWLRELYDAEHRLTDVLPTLADAIDWPPARRALRREFVKSFRRLTRLEEALTAIGSETRRLACDTIVVLERDLADTAPDPRERPIQLLARLRAVLQFSRSSYQTSQLLADSIGRHSVSQILRDAATGPSVATEELDSLLATAARAEATNR